MRMRKTLRCVLHHPKCVLHHPIFNFIKVCTWARLVTLLIEVYHVWTW